MNLIDVIVRFFLILLSAYGITIGTIYLVTLAKIDIEDVSQRNGAKFMSIALIGNFSFIIVVYLMMNYLDKKDLFSLGFYITWVNVLLGLIMFVLTVFIALLFVYVLQQMGVVKQGRLITVAPSGSSYKTVEQGAATNVWCAASTQLDGKGGIYCLDVDIAEVVPAFTLEGETQVLEGVLAWAIDPDLAERLWQLSEEMTGLQFPT